MEGLKNQNNIRIEKSVHLFNQEAKSNFIIEKTKSISSLGFRNSILSLIEDTISSALGTEK